MIKRIPVPTGIKSMLVQGAVMGASCGNHKKNNDPLNNEVSTNTAGVLNVYQKMQQMVGYLKVDMTNALEVLITYQDSDGD